MVASRQHQAGRHDIERQDACSLSGEMESVAAVVNDRGSIVEGYGYDAYGKMWGTKFLSGDFNADGLVNLTDFSTFSSGMGDPTNNPATDLTGNGITDGEDFATFSANLGYPAAAIKEGMSGSDYQFTGRPLHYFKVVDGEDTYELRLADHRRRMYDPHHGRWMQRDPAGYVDGYNLYQYSGSRPTGFVDPFGLKKCCVTSFQAPASKSVKTVEDLPGGGQRLRQNIVVTAEFDDSAPGCCPECCEYRQFVVGHFRRNGNNVGGSYNLVEDCTGWGCAGHRGSSWLPWNGYMRSRPFALPVVPDQQFGQHYLLVDHVSYESNVFGATIEIDLMFLGEIWDVCNNNRRVRYNAWYVFLKHVVGGPTEGESGPQVPQPNYLSSESL